MVRFQNESSRHRWVCMRLPRLAGKQQTRPRQAAAHNPALNDCRSRTSHCCHCSVSFCATQPWCASGSTDGRVYIWDLASLTVRHFRAFGVHWSTAGSAPRLLVTCAGKNCRGSSYGACWHRAAPCLICCRSDTSCRTANLQFGCDGCLVRRFWRLPLATAACTCGMRAMAAAKPS